MGIKLIVAHDESRGIGRGVDMPWHIPAESKWTAHVTRTAAPGRRNALIMGRTTYFSIPENRRPLVDRANIVISSQKLDLEDGAFLAPSFHDALQLAATIPDIDDAFIFGGAQIYRQALYALAVDELLISVVPGDHGCDTFFPDIPSEYALKSSTPTRDDTVEVRHDHYVRA